MYVANAMLCVCQITLPDDDDDDESTAMNYGSTSCLCRCHTDNPKPDYRRRSKHCLSCGVKVSANAPRSFSWLVLQICCNGIYLK